MKEEISMHKNSRLLRALRRESVDSTPVWIMRQAGRYLEEYNKLRKKFSFLDLCSTPEQAAEVTLLPSRKFDLDALILFSDILLILISMGFDIEYKEKTGPVIHNPLRTEQDLKKLRQVQPEGDLAYVMEAIRLLKERKLPLLGFSGAPFTLATYAIEGGHSRNHVKTKSMMYTNPGLFHEFMKLISDAVSEYLRAQARAGVDAVQMFDTWVGILSYEDYRDYVLPHSRFVLDSMKGVAPAIHFAQDGSHLLPLVKEAGGDAIGVDWRSPLDTAWNIIGSDRAIQGNLDPVALLGPAPVIVEKTNEILRRAHSRPGHIFNLGHGILPQTPPDSVKVLIETIRKYSPED